MYNSPETLLHGERVKKRQGWVLLIALGLALSAPALLRARTHAPQTGAQKKSQKAAKSYNKELHKAQKHQAKLQKKQMKQWKKQHRTTTTVL